MRKYEFINYDMLKEDNKTCIIMIQGMQKVIQELYEKNDNVNKLKEELQDKVTRQKRVLKELNNPDDTVNKVHREMTRLKHYYEIELENKDKIIEHLIECNKSLSNDIEELEKEKEALTDSLLHSNKVAEELLKENEELKIMLQKIYNVIGGYDE